MWKERQKKEQRKKYLRISEKERGQFESQELDGWTVLKLCDGEGC